MKDRIIQFIEAEKLTPAEFADTINVQRSSVSHVLNGRNNPGFSFIQKILDTFPTLNSRWLLTGIGKMYESKPTPVTEQVPNLFNSTTKDSSNETDVNVHSDEHVQPQENVQKNKQEDTHQVKVPTNKKVIKVLIFYDDHTFEDFRPAE